MTSLLLNLSNLLLSHIISSIDDNGDIVCLLLTCKQLYNNNNVRKSILFKGIGEAIDTDSGHESIHFKSTATRFNLLSFQDIYENSISDQHPILSDQTAKKTYKYPDWIQQRIYAESRADKSGVTTALVIDTFKVCLRDTIDRKTVYPPRGEQSRSWLYRTTASSPITFGSFGQSSSWSYPTLKSLILDLTTLYSLADLGLTILVSLTELTFEWVGGFLKNVGPGLLPNSLTFLSIRVMGIPPRDTFLSLTSLVTLEIFIQKRPIDQETEQPFIDLESLSNLKTLTFNDNYEPTKNTNYSIEISVPLSLTVLTLWSESAQIPSRCTMPLLEKLYATQRSLVDGKVCLLPCNTPSIKKLYLNDCKEIFPANITIIPSTVEKITICKSTKESILTQVVFPPSLTHLSIVGSYEPVQLPDSLVKLKQLLKTPIVSTFEKTSFGNELENFKFRTPILPSTSS
ncbi:hypothetical protein DFA_08421 [Cavenderia fasciculata]|uniref:Uncharacterized protein n=1 Tax=Cavenderia fasciculata TaxID=261658 RepID=F4Q617_CACFS|nr:uncharacterized protein DFA_08421 [Cavenderia fasciculata]EGG17426.1 hypothetical protein DFA_08421 [Cavenderia fasciculata]|eukprot:XP_004355910.1 hypothetical protein DFA_08421 [Cavenderia fasciculata]